MLTDAAAMPWWMWLPMFFLACFVVFLALASQANWAEWSAESSHEPFPPASPHRRES